MKLEKFEDLAKLKVDKNRENFDEHFKKMLNYFSQLKEIDTKAIEPLFNPVEMSAPLRDDIEGRSIDRLTALNLAPDYYLEFFKTPSPYKK
ncbi:MAG: Asp-tRNA(Asn)/Glu-tRNA(Gln) amidotransferase subunit GatC [candidate division WOR-3 bacterium]|nr:Asp-tRNA(Asn)/Glu-tRNA(Gln) amidotransferase subunit GatC [candidate division WOR-3 bacterium]MCX7947631.1 Asp-tRNA(Asn)/Glu-tRNA(Gln) amidotransferase subunit GatC [candidate division WOR-3 bacterium]MDW8150509.1 Asp-tRNA(Asn)/Glu-tRNA(Gln) amidotransferase subunit GatC [candidate division WOR-3 bacterium]